MHIAAISASQIAHARENSTSTRVCELVRQLIHEKHNPYATFDILTLADADLRPCQGCGACLELGCCARDPVFNGLFHRLAQADALFVVAAHYAPIPSRLAMLLEKIEQLAFLPRFHDETVHSPLYHKPVGIIGHCGGTVELLDHGYKGQILDTIANALSWPVEMTIVGVDERQPNGVLFPVQRVTRDPAHPFPIQEYDWKDIRRRIEPLVDAVAARLAARHSAVLNEEIS